MATRQVKECDVFGTLRDVKTYAVRVLEILPPPPDGEILDPVCVLNAELKDLGPRAFKRLTKKIKDGLAPPTKGKTTEVQADE